MFLNVFVFNYKPQVNYSIVSFEYYIVDVNKMNTRYNLRVLYTVRHKARFPPDQPRFRNCYFTGCPT